MSWKLHVNDDTHTPLVYNYMYFYSWIMVKIKVWQINSHIRKIYTYL